MVVAVGWVEGGLLRESTKDVRAVTLVCMIPYGDTMSYVCTIPQKVVRQG